MAVVVKRKLKIYVKDTLPQFQFTVYDEDGNVQDLSLVTGANVYIRKEDAAANIWSDGDTTATVSDAPNGRVDWDIPTGGFAAGGSHSGQLLLTFASGTQQTERFRFPVEDGLRP